MKNVLIVGGGIAGITAAYHLSKSGYKVQILEVTDNLGGRLTALFDSKSGEMIDNGQHALMTAYHTFLELLKECNADNLLNIQKHLEVTYYDTNQKKTRLYAGYLPSKTGFVLGFLMLGGLSIKSKINIIKLMRLIEKNPQSSYYSELSCIDFLKQTNQTNDAISRFWEPFVVATMNCTLEQASASILINILRRAFIEDLENSKLILPAADLRYILQPVIEKLKSQNVEIFCSTKVSRLLFDGKKIIGAETSKGEKYFADYIISALQPYSLLKILPNSLLEQFSYLEKFTYSPIVSVFIWTNHELFNEDFVATLGTDIQWIFNRNKIIKHGLTKTFKHTYSITTSTAAKFSSMKQSEIIDCVASDIKKVFPHFEKENILHYRIITEKFATFIANQQTEKIRPDTVTSIPNFLLAGDWTNTKLPATIEGASFSGKKAAEAVIGQSKKKLI